ncbi:MAG: hypothetical protein DMD41_03475 [Gemmatimonadetes bacterium]|nr:MAG: hypothetical protein DMD41_03475 [Gemmatimonadota bacterium]
MATSAPRTGALRVELPPKELDTRLRESLDAEGAVLDTASRELARARKAVRETRQRLVAQLEAILAGLDPHERAGDAAVTVRNGRYVIPVRTTSRARVGGIVHDESATRATVFVEPPEVIELGNELRSREAAEQREVLRVLRALTDLLRPHRAAIAAAWEMSIAFDDLCARARYAVVVNGFTPVIGEGPLVIRGGRHPLLFAGDTVVVPFDLELAPDECTVLVSGPNTGGKTVLIKAVGLLCLLAQSGVVPPIGPQSRLPVFRDVFADIGDRQSIAASLSTFSAHVAALRDILDRAGPGSLVLLDEIGSGTDPAEGAQAAGRRDGRDRERLAAVRRGDPHADVSAPEGRARPLLRAGDRAAAGNPRGGSRRGRARRAGRGADIGRAACCRGSARPRAGTAAGAACRAGSSAAGGAGSSRPSRRGRSRPRAGGLGPGAGAGRCGARAGARLPARRAQDCRGRPRPGARGRG